LKAASPIEMSGGFGGSLPTSSTAAIVVSRVFICCVKYELKLT
jgi:hypothetical protein